MSSIFFLSVTGRNYLAAWLSLLLAVFSVQIARAQQPAGSWNDYFRPEQTETLTDQARRAIRDQRYVEAEALFDQALQVNRASRGLHNPSQLALVDLVLEVLLLQRKWDEFDQKLDYLGWLNSRIYADDPDRLAAGLLRQSDWHRAAAGAIQRSQSAWYLIQGKYLNWQAVSVLETRYGRQDTRLAPILYQIVLEHYYQSVLNERRGATSYEYRSEDRSVANGWMFSRNESVKRSYRIGRENLQRIRDIYRAVPEVPKSTDALLQIYQADWEFLHGNTQVALAWYQEAYLSLLAAGIAESEVEQFFNQLQVVPPQRLQTEWLKPIARDNEAAVEFIAWSNLYPGAEIPAEFVKPPFDSLGEDASVQLELKLEVGGDPESGNFTYGVTGLNILHSSPDNESTSNKVFAEMPLVKFRPRLVAGELTSHGPFLLNYRFSGE